jgi:hypothetical protein
MRIDPGGVKRLRLQKAQKDFGNSGTACLTAFHADTSRRSPRDAVKKRSPKPHCEIKNAVGCVTWADCRLLAISRQRSVAGEETIN